MTAGQFQRVYSSHRYVDPSFGEQVETYAFALLAHRDAARTIRHEVFKAAYEQCATFETETAWVGDKHTGWTGLKAMTRACCLQMLLLPVGENPLAKAESARPADEPTTKLELWYRLVGELPFEQRRIQMLAFLFGMDMGEIAEVLEQDVGAVTRLKARADAELGVQLLKA